MNFQSLQVKLGAIACILIMIASLQLMLPGDSALQGGARQMTNVQSVLLSYGTVVAAALALVACAVVASVLGQLSKGVHELLGCIEQADATEDAGSKTVLRVGGDKLVMLFDGIDKIVKSCRQLRRERDSLSMRVVQAERAVEEAIASAVLSRERAEASRRDGLLSAARTLGVAIDGIHASCDELRALSEASGAGAQRQQDLMRDAAAATECLDKAVRQMQTRATSAVDQAGLARDKAQDGSGTVEETVFAIREVERKAQDLASVVRELGGQALAVEKIMDVISDIADQTNLLALNAAIEAARAGDAGRGFAVVADEVRKLAEKTMSATREVAQRTLDIQQGVERTERDMEETASRVASAVGLAQVSGESLREIVNLADDTARNIRDMAEAADEQAQSSGRIGDIVRQVKRISEQSHAGAQSSLSSVTGLLGRVVELESMNAVFQLIGGGAIQAVVDGLAADSRILSMDRAEQEAALRQALTTHASLELLYLTDARGRQVVSNMGRGSGGISADASAFGRDWSRRPWFTQPVQSRGMAVSEVYVSSATGENCITVSAPVYAKSGDLLCVIGVDVNLGRATASRAA